MHCPDTLGPAGVRRGSNSHCPKLAGWIELRPRQDPKRSLEMVARTFVAFCAILSLTSYLSAQDRDDRRDDRREERRDERREDRREQRFISGRVVKVVDGDTCLVEDRDGR